jgi:hypothetical protein
MRITVVGAILIVATVVASVLLLLALDEAENRPANKENVGSPQDQPLPYGTGV